MSAVETRPKSAEELVAQVKDRYGKIASGTLSGCCGPAPSTTCCGSSDEETVALAVGYASGELKTLPEGANLGLGCGAPIPALDLKPGETLLDLGSGAGIDCFLALRQVGPTGRVIGVDMTPAMLEKARAHAARIGATNVEFREGRLEALPVEDASVDAVTSNCVINLVPDKPAVFREVARVLKPGGRIVVSDILLDGQLPATLEQDLLAYVGCVAGAIQRERYFAELRAAGLTRIEVLKDVDYLAQIGDAVPEEVRGIVERTGVRPADVAGKVRSVTFRASRG